MTIRVDILRNSPERETEQTMVPVACCDGIEAALASGVLVAPPSGRGVVYIQGARRLWAIQFCPHCGAGLELPPSDAPLEVAPLSSEEPPTIARKKRRKCALCAGAGHDARNCPLTKRKKT